MARLDSTKNERLVGLDCSKNGISVGLDRIEIKKYQKGETVLELRKNSRIGSY